MLCSIFPNKEGSEILQNHHVKCMTGNVGGLIMVRKEGWLAEILYQV